MSEIIVVSKTQRIVVDPVSSVVAVISAGPQGPPGIPGEPGDPGGPAGPAGEDGEGVPPGGNAGQVLAKATLDDYDTEWIDPPAGGGSGVPSGGTTGQVLAKASVVNGDVDWVDPAEGTVGPAGPAGSTGPAGPGVATGGTTGQMLAKLSGVNYHTGWVDAPEGGEAPVMNTTVRTYDVDTSYGLLSFTKEAAALLTEDDWNKSSMYWPCAFKVTDYIDTPLDDYYLIWSTDHDAGDGGIGLAHGPSPLGPFTVANSGDPVFVDTTNGDECETPSVIWNPVTELFHMYYQINKTSGGQRTFLTTTADFETFNTPVEVLTIQTTPVLYIGDGHHTGYFTPQRIGGMWFGISLLTSGDYSTTIMWYSYDGIDWTMDYSPLGWNSHLTDSIDHSAKVSTHWMKYFEINGVLWGLANEAVFASGLVVSDVPWVMGPVSSDKKQFIGMPIDVTPSSAAWEDDNRGGVRSIIIEDNVVYAYYRATNASDKHGIGVAVGVWS